MATLDEIRRLVEYYTKHLYNDVRAEQDYDQSFIDDTFVVPEVRWPHTPLRSGLGYEIVSAPAEMIVTSNPQAFFDRLQGKEDSIDRIGKYFNGSCMYVWRRQNPNMFKELVKNKLGRGESYISARHNETWVTGNKDKKGLPFILLTPEPMTVYGSPEEDDCGWEPNSGVPNCVIVNYKRQPLDVMLRYPSWSNPMKKVAQWDKDTKEENKYVDWVEYWDKESIYMEADGEPILKGVSQPNLYKFTPFVRKYSGFGKRSPEGKLDELIVSDIRRSRDLIREECSLRSDIASILHIFAHKPVTITMPPGTELNEKDTMKNLNLGAYSVNLLYLPDGSEIYWGDTIVPNAEMFHHLESVRGEVRERHPFIMAGFPLGTSGRQQDMSATAGMRRYDTIIENTEEEVATAIEMAFEICRRIPTLKNIDGLQKADFDTQFKCRVELKADDPVEADRKATLGSRLFQQGEIDLKTNLVEYQGYTEDEADEIITNILVEKVTLGSPDIAELIGLRAAEKSGMAEDLQMLRQRRMQLEAGMTQGVGQAEMTQRVGEVATQTGREMGLDFANRGQRQPPERYFREG